MGLDKKKMKNETCSQMNFTKQSYIIIILLHLP